MEISLFSEDKFYGFSVSSGIADQEKRQTLKTFTTFAMIFSKA